jgi:ESCRT-II complex subunit VPS25
MTTPQISSTTTLTSNNAPFAFPPTYSFPPFFTPQPNSTTRLSQLQKWSSLVQSWCRHHKTYRLSLIEAVESPLFHNAALRKRVPLAEARDILDWMAESEENGGGGRRVEWIDGGNKTVAWVWWRRPEEWAGILADWVCPLVHFRGMVVGWMGC